MAIKNSEIIEAAKTGMNLGRLTFEELATAKDSKGYTALDVAACHGHLDKVQGEVTAAQLATVRNKDHQTPLHIAAGFGHLDQIKGATAEQLAVAQTESGHSALAAAALYGWLKQVEGGVTFEQLVGTNNSDNWTLTLAAQSGSLDQVKDGVTAQQILSHDGPDLMRTLVRAGNLHQLKGGVKVSELQVKNPNTPHLTAFKALTRMISWTTNEQVTLLANNLVGCPEAVRLLDCQNVNHQQALRDAVVRNREIENYLTHELVAILL